MQYIEKYADLFNIDDPDVWFVQCISADFACGKGIAIEFNKRFSTKQELLKYYRPDVWNGKGYCLVTSHVLNLVTKAKYYMKPSEKTMRTALKELRNIVITYGIKSIAMPKIGCGLDRMDWEVVRSFIQELFGDIDDLNITVCYKWEEKRNLW